MRQLINAGVHFGHTTRRWNPRMEPYIFGVRAGIHILDLQQTVPLFHQALVQVQKVAANGGRVLFVGTKRQAADKVKECAQKCGQYYVNHRWLGGMLTNWNTISNSINSLKELEKHLEEHGDSITKKERLSLTRRHDKLELALGGIRDMAGIPDIMIVIDVNQEEIAVKEATKLGIPVVGILDSNSNPAGVDYPVPGNDDATRSIELYCELFAAAVLDGIQQEVKASGVDIGTLENPINEQVPAERTEAHSENVNPDLATAPIAEQIDETVEEVQKKVAAAK